MPRIQKANQYVNNQTNSVVFQISEIKKNYLFDRL